MKQKDCQAPAGHIGASPEDCRGVAPGRSDIRDTATITGSNLAHLSLAGVDCVEGLLLCMLRVNEARVQYGRQHDPGPCHSEPMFPCQVLISLKSSCACDVCRKQESCTGGQSDSGPCRHEAQLATQDVSAMLHIQDQQTNKDQCLQQQACHDSSKTADNISARQSQVEQQATTAQQKRKKRRASQTGEDTADDEKEVDRVQTAPETVTSAGCKGSKRQRPDNRAP